MTEVLEALRDGLQHMSGNMHTCDAKRCPQCVRGHRASTMRVCLECARQNLRAAIASITHLDDEAGVPANTAEETE